MANIISMNEMVAIPPGTTCIFAIGNTECYEQTTPYFDKRYVVKAYVGGIPFDIGGFDTLEQAQEELIYLKDAKEHIGGNYRCGDGLRYDDFGEPLINGIF